MKFDLTKGYWHCEPKEYEVTEDSVKITTEPDKDFWKDPASDYQRDNAPALLFKIDEEKFMLTVKTTLDYKGIYDQAGLLVYHDSNNWFKMSAEYKNEEYSLLGGVLAQGEVSDWAASYMDSNVNEIYYRLKKQNGAFRAEYSFDGENFKFMRQFRLLKSIESSNIGFYASSPADFSFTTTFSEVNFETEF